MRAIICYCDIEVAKEVKQPLRNTSLDVMEIEPENRSTEESEFLEVADKNTAIRMSVAFHFTFESANPLESRIVIYVPWKWRHYLMGKDPDLLLAAKIRSILTEQTVGSVVFKDLT